MLHIFTFSFFQVLFYSKFSKRVTGDVASCLRCDHFSSEVCCAMKNTGHITPSRKKQVEMWPIWCVLSPRQDAFIFDNAQFNMKDFMMVLLPVEYFRSKTQELSLI